jgi:hypothetical protein
MNMATQFFGTTISSKVGEAKTINKRAHKSKIKTKYCRQEEIQR